MIVKVEWWCEHGGMLRAYEDNMCGEYDKYIWCCGFHRDGKEKDHPTRVVLKGTMGMTDRKFALVRAVRKAFHPHGIFKVDYTKVLKGKPKHKEMT